MIYALYTYHWRANSIRKGGKGPYDDRLGPVGSSTLIPSSIGLTAFLDRSLRRTSWYAHSYTQTLPVNLVLTA
jgi:hypothetical protein